MFYFAQICTFQGFWLKLKFLIYFDQNTFICVITGIIGILCQLRIAIWLRTY